MRAFIYTTVCRERGGERERSQERWRRRGTARGNARKVEKLHQQRRRDQLWRLRAQQARLREENWRPMFVTATSS